MKAHADSHFVIGASHIRQNTPCEDHARASIIEASGYISLSDGCSGGGETDTGSRILNSAAAIALSDYIAGSTFSPNEQPIDLGKIILPIAQSIATSMRLTNNDLRATLLYAVTTPDGGFIHAFGDGNILIMHTDGSITWYELEWSQDKPYYLNYTGSALAGFLAAHDADPDGSFIVRKIMRAADGAKSVTTETYTATEGIYGYGIPITKDMQDSIQAILLSSDGLQSFKRENERVDANEIIDNLICFKQWGGEFIKRRLSRMLSDLAKTGTVAMDDMSVAAIHFTS